MRSAAAHERCDCTDVDRVRGHVEQLHAREGWRRCVALSTVEQHAEARPRSFATALLQPSREDTILGPLATHVAAHAAGAASVDTEKKDCYRGSPEADVLLCNSGLEQG